MRELSVDEVQLGWGGEMRREEESVRQEGPWKTA